MCNSFFNKFFCFESSLKWSHVNTWVNLKQVDFLKGYCTIDLTSADWQVREPTANNIFLITFILNYRLNDLTAAHSFFFNKINIVFDSLDINLFNVWLTNTISSIILHFHFLGMCLIELIFTFLLLDHLEVRTFHFIFFWF